MSYYESNKKLHVLIVGAGLGGLMLAALLERQGVSYLVLERAAKIVPLGSALGVGANILPVYEQLGIYDDLLKISKCSEFFVIKNERGEDIGKVDMSDYEERTGYGWLVSPRPELQELFLNQVPKDKVLYNKKVLNIQQTSEKVTVVCADNSTYDGDILVGADGAYSIVRTSMFKEVKDEGTLPKSDQEPLLFSNSCLVGTTDPLDPAKFPGVDAPKSLTLATIAENSRYQSLLFGVPNNRICWFVNERLTEVMSKSHDNFKHSEWGPEGVEKMMNNVKDIPCPIAPGLTLNDIFVATPKENISKVSLEEKLFECWYSKRVVLIGDAAHKMLPDSGQGAINAMQDAVVLANRIYDMSDNTLPEIETAFAAYRKERYPYAKNSVETSQDFGNVIMAKSWFDKLFRKIMINYVPKWVTNIIIDRMHYHRPMACFLPEVPTKGIGKVNPQTPSKRNMKLEQ